jgi:hypothetical protein
MKEIAPGAYEKGKQFVGGVIDTSKELYERPAEKSQEIADAALSKGKEAYNSANYIILYVRFYIP